jgi:DNA invertase Pin-like site-specific DNA recombinase
MAGYVAYYRVSTDKQGASGLGLEAQREAVARNLGAGSLLAEFTEVESGKRSANRPQLIAALEMCKRKKAILLIAKLDRLARNVHFISGLMEAGVEFVAADMPTANRLTVHIMAAFAEHEAAMISARTKAALQAAKARGTVLGNPRWQAGLVKGAAGEESISANSSGHSDDEATQRRRVHPQSDSG